MAEKPKDSAFMTRFTIDVSTEGNSDIVNLTPLLRDKVKDIRGDGLVHVFIGGSTAAITTLEFEPGLVKHDMPAIFQKLVPDNAKYEHEQTWNDDNGHAHVRSALLGPGVTIPIGNGKLLTGEYQQVVLMDFDTRPRKRKIVCTVMV
jgi:secondary thiamine-phosphate synthase enzyme